MFGGTNISRANEFQVEGAVHPKGVDQEDWLLSLDLSRDMLDDVLNVKHDCEDLYICSTTEQMSKGPQMELTVQTLSEPSTQVVACLARRCYRN